MNTQETAPQPLPCALPGRAEILRGDSSWGHSQGPARPRDKAPGAAGRLPPDAAAGEQLGRGLGTEQRQGRAASLQVFQGRSPSDSPGGPRGGVLPTLTWVSRCWHGPVGGQVLRMLGNPPRGPPPSQALISSDFYFLLHRLSFESHVPIPGKGGGKSPKRGREKWGDMCRKKGTLGCRRAGLCPSRPLGTAVRRAQRAPWWVLAARSRRDPLWTFGASFS